MATPCFPKISIVIPNYNHASCLATALECACTQDPPPHEVYVFDDCSTDNSWEVIESFARRYSFVKALRYPRKSVDWQKACFENIPLVSGDWVLALAADDMIYPGFIKAVGEMVERYPQCGIVITDVDNISNEYGVVPCRRGWDNRPFLEGEQLQEKLRDLQVSECGSSTIIRKDALLWLNQLNATAMGPWFDSIGFAVVGLKHGACYVPSVLGAVCFTGDNPTWSEAFHLDAKNAIATFEHVANFLRSPEVASFVPPDSALILEAKVVARLPREISQAILTPRFFGQTQELIQAGRFHEADRWLSWILNSVPNLAKLQSDWGIVKYSLGQTANAEACFRRALAVDPTLASAHSNLAVCLQARGDVEEAIVAYRRAVELDPHFVNAYANLGSLLLEQGRYQEALPALQWAVHLNPQEWTAMANQCKTLHALGRSEEAHALNRKALAIKQGSDQFLGGISAVSY